MKDEAVGRLAEPKAGVREEETPSRLEGRPPAEAVGVENISESLGKILPLRFFFKCVFRRLREWERKISDELKNGNAGRLVIFNR